jgi:hypothetical protein
MNRRRIIAQRPFLQQSPFDLPMFTSAGFEQAEKSKIAKRITTDVLAR